MERTVITDIVNQFTVTINFIINTHLGIGHAQIGDIDRKITHCENRFRPCGRVNIDHTGGGFSFFARIFRINITAHTDMQCLGIQDGNRCGAGATDQVGFIVEVRIVHTFGTGYQTEVDFIFTRFIEIGRHCSGSASKEVQVEEIVGIVVHPVSGPRDFTISAVNVVAIAGGHSGHIRTNVQ